MSKPIRFIVTYYSGDSITRESELITDPVLEIVHSTYGANQLDNIGDDYVQVRSRKHLSECGYLGTFALAKNGLDHNTHSKSYKVTIEIDGTEYDYAFVHDHYAEIQVLLENDRMEKLLEEI